MSDAAAPLRNTGQWWVRVRGEAYGPYSMTQLSGFVLEGRVSAATNVSNRPNGAWIEARRVIGLLGEAGNHNAAQSANVIVHAEIMSGAWNAFMAALESLGSVCELAPGLALLRTRYTVGMIRNTLSQTVERGDRFVVIDASRDRLAWFNLGMEVDARIAKVWNGPPRAAPL